MAQLVNPVNGAMDAISGGMNKVLPPSPLPVPVSKSLLFEIIDTVTEMVVESFALVIPPNAFSIREPQRVNVTKTFGNIFVDDYGPDNPQIMIKGWSGTAHAFPTYQPRGNANQQDAFSMQSQAQSEASGAVIGYNHQAAFHAFRDSIMRYKYNYPDTYDKLKLRLYDLNDQQSYDCILMDFGCDREASRPLYYPYSITLLVYNMPDVMCYAPTEVIETGGIVDQIIDGINTGMNWISAGFSFVSGVMGFVNSISNTLTLLSKQMDTYINQAGAAAISPLIATKGLISSVASFHTLIETAYANGRMVKSEYLKAKESIIDTWYQSIKLYGQAIKIGQQSARTDTIEFDKGLLITSITEQAVRNAEYQSYSYSGIRVYTVRGMDTLQSIAQNELGDSTLWPYVAKLNKIVNNVELHQKSQIYLPVKTRATNKDAYIVSERSDRDPYGTDIFLDTNGAFVFSNNDFVLTSGVQNVIQWVNSILKTPKGSVLKHTVLGINGIIGSPGDDAALGYLVPGLKMALQIDPRIKKITNVIADIDADVIKLSFNLGIVDYDKTLPVSVSL